MRIIQVVLCVLALDSAILYLYENAFAGVASAGGGTSGVAYGWLAIAAALSVSVLVLRAFSSARISLKGSTIFLVAFTLYFLLKAVLDLGASEDLKAFTIATTGGLLFGYALGFLASMSMQGLVAVNVHSKSTRRVATLGLLSVILLSCIMLIVGYLETRGDLRAVYLLVMNSQGYQRSGNYLSIAFLLVSLATVSVVYINKRFGRLENMPLVAVAIGVYVLSTPLMMFEAQLLGSNSALLFAGAIFVPTVAYLWIGLRGKTISGRRLKLSRVAGVGILTIGVLAILSWGAVNAFNIDVSRLRVFNYGEGGTTPSSITTRLSVLQQDYLTQLDYEPFFGNMKVDQITTGKGTYAHSLPLSLLSHLGVLGFSLFAIFLYLRMRELLRSRSWCGVTVGFGERQRTFQSFVFFALLAIVLIGTVSTFFVWLPLWFALGLLTPPVVLARRTREKVAIAHEQVPGTLPQKEIVGS